MSFIPLLFICIYLVLPSFILNPTGVASFCNSWNISLRAFRDLAFPNYVTTRLGEGISAHAVRCWPPDSPVPTYTHFLHPPSFVTQASPNTPSALFFYAQDENDQPITKDRTDFPSHGRIFWNCLLLREILRHFVTNAPLWTDQAATPKATPRRTTTNYR